jgi:hypothetical protein
MNLMKNDHIPIWASVVILILLCLSLSTSAKAQDTFSPRLIKFLESHPAASCTFSNEIMKAKGTANNRIEIFYFYNNDPNALTAHHNMFAQTTEIAIFVLEGQEPCDEYLDILFEVLNLSGDKRFQELYQQAMSGSISRSNFVSEMLRQEFQTVKTLQHLIPSLRLTPQEISKSKDYDIWLHSPDDFDDFVIYSRKHSGGRVEMLYEHYYDDFHAKSTSEKLVAPQKP